VESVSAAAAVLDVLAERGLVLVSSHNLILAPLLAHRLDAYCLGRSTGGQVLLPGVLKETNGVALLAEHGFDKRVEQRALQVARWLGEYMAPADCGHVLQPGETAAVRAR
jgi:hypothetical protein